MALVICAAIGLPALEGIVSLALQAAWAFGESLMDVRQTFGRREGAAGKNRSNLDGVDQSAGEADRIAEKWKICGTKRV